MSRHYLTTTEAAEYLRRSPRTLQELTRLRRIPCRKLAGTRALVFVADELDQWVDGCALEVTDSPDGGFTVRPIAPKTKLRRVG